MTKQTEPGDIARAVAWSLTQPRAEMPPRPVRKPPRKTKTQSRDEWLRACAVYAAENWRRQLTWWRENRAPEASLLSSFDAEGIVEACADCWLLALRFGIGNAHELRRAGRALEEPLPDYATCDRMLDEAELAVDGLKYTAKVWRDIKGAADELEEQRALDLVHDPVCAKLRELLKRDGPQRIKALMANIAMCEKKTVQRRLKAMKAAGMVTQTGRRGPYRWVSDTPTNDTAKG